MKGSLAKMSMPLLRWLNSIRVEVIVTLSGFQLPRIENGQDHTEHAKICEKSFEAFSKPIRDFIANFGGEVSKDLLWLNGSILAIVSIPCLMELAREGQVEKIELSKQIFREAGQASTKLT